MLILQRRTNTRITMRTLKAIAKEVPTIRNDVQSTLHLINPISRDLVFDGGFDCHAVEDIICHLKCLEGTSNRARPGIIDQ